MKRRTAVVWLSFVVAASAFAQTTQHDRMFADTMAQHHKDGIRMAQLAADKAESAELRSMAHRMIDDQQREVGELQSLRGDGPMTSMAEMESMAGMMSHEQMQSDMARLESATGRDFDLAFTEIMAEHHQGAVTMARHELEMGSNAGLREIARQIASKQTRERQQLLAMHRGLGGDPSMISSSAERERLAKE